MQWGRQGSLPLWAQAYAGEKPAQQVYAGLLCIQAHKWKGIGISNTGYNNHYLLMLCACLLMIVIDDVN